MFYDVIFYHIDMQKIVINNIFRIMFQYLSFLFINQNNIKN